MSAFQGSIEWLAQRAGRITGSRVAAILGLDKYKTRDDVMREMVREHHGAPREFEGNEATAHGHAHEDEAIALYEHESGHLVISTGQHVHVDHHWLAASPDGLIDGNGLIEVKCPFRAKYTTAAEVPHYIAQMQLQMAVTGRDWCDFVIWRDGQIITERVESDPLWLHEHLPTLEAFMAEYRATIGSDEMAARHLTPLIREDATWQALEADYADAKAEADLASERLEQIKKALIKAAGEQTRKAAQCK